jgi:hypothetical protein
VDQEVGGSSPPSCTRKINNLSDTAAMKKSTVSALCPQSHCRSSGRSALIAMCRPAPTCAQRGRAFMSEERDDQERPCLHCMIIELIDDFFADNPASRLGQSRYRGSR